MRLMATALMAITLGGCVTGQEGLVESVQVSRQAMPVQEAKSRILVALQARGYRLARDTDLMLEFDDPVPPPPVVDLLYTCNICSPARSKLRLTVAATPTETVVNARQIIVANPGSPVQREIDQQYKIETANDLRGEIARALDPPARPGSATRRPSPSAGPPVSLRPQN
jgi:hypothetical protein